MNARCDLEKQSGRKTLLVAAGGYLLFIVYGSLVPLAFNPRPIEVAWRDFLAIRYFVLGAGSRADWVANILLYMPLAYLLSAGLAAPRGPVAAQLLRAGAVFLACAALALGVEFTQLFFPPRTVSINDIVAELIGSALGIGVWRVWGDALERLWNEMKHGGLVAIRAALVVYVLAYLTLSLFPYDFYLSTQEFSQKLVSDRYGLLVAPVACGQWLGCIGKLVAEMIAVVPLGALLSMVLGRAAQRVYRNSALCGLALGAAVEIVQLFVASGVSQGVSVLTRAAGLALGVAVHRSISAEVLRKWWPHLRSVTALSFVPYLLAVMWFNGWFRSAWGGLDQAVAHFEALHWVPLYYHYFTTETAAVLSVLAQTAIYLPVGVGCWIWFGPLGKLAGGGWRMSAWLGALLAVSMESGKLFASALHPDPTNVLIAALAAASGNVVCARFFAWFVRSTDAAELAPAPVQPNKMAIPPGRLPPWRLLLALLLVICVVVLAASYPLSRGWLSTGLVGYAVLLWFRPAAWVPALLGLLPLLDFAPWSGWIFVDELDLFVVTTLAVKLARQGQGFEFRGLPRFGGIAVTCLALSYASSALIGLFPLQPLDHDSFASYYSHFNSLRVLKGFAWALLLLPCLMAEMRAGEITRVHIATGMLLGLCGVTLAAGWERVAFSGLFNFSRDFRITATFPEMHTGGGYVEAYLAAAIPFVAAWMMSGRGIVRRAGGLALFAAATYALAVTFARSGYLAYAGALSIFGTGALLHRLRMRVWRWSDALIIVGLLATSCAVVVPILAGSYMQDRFSSVRRDAATREHHWTEAVNLMTEDWTTTLFGMGLGSFPRTYFLKNRDGIIPATYSLRSEDGNVFLRLGSGDSLYYEQRIDVKPGRTYALSFDARSSSPNPGLTVPVCEKSILYSFDCQWLTIDPIKRSDTWLHYEKVFQSETLGKGAWYARRPVSLALYNGRGGTVVDVDNVRLLDEYGNNLVSNGDFSAGHQRWFFSTDNHLPWHIKNLWVAIFFEQGWFGLLAIAGALSLALYRLVRKVGRGDVFSSAVLASLSGFLLVGFFDSPFDSPRLAFLFYFMLFAAWTDSASQAGAQGAGDSERMRH